MHETEATNKTDSVGPAGRPPATLIEHIIGNCRPWPALPAVLALVLTLMPAFSGGAAAGTVSGWVAVAVAAGLLISCALAIAAGFCSLVPQSVWIAGAIWALSLVNQGLLPAWHAWVLYPAIAATLAMIGVQLWRIGTGRFVPTIVDPVIDPIDGPEPR